MNLFINALSENWKIILFNESREIISEKDIKILWNESEKLIWFIDDFLNENNLEYRNIENIVVASWPWSFTWIRTIVLMVNTINFVINKNITSLNYFDLFDNYPIIKASSKRDSFLKKSKNSEVEIIKNDDIIEYIKENNITTIYWENKNITILLTNNSNSVEILENINYCNIIKNIEFQNNKKIEPIYIKKPSIG